MLGLSASKPCPREDCTGILKLIIPDAEEGDHLFNGLLLFFPATKIYILFAGKRLLNSVETNIQEVACPQL